MEMPYPMFVFFAVVGLLKTIDYFIEKYYDDDF